jgi:HTH-type transcriptional regulator / antitoxin HipB
MCDNVVLSCLDDIHALSSISNMTDYSIKTPEQLGAVLRGFRVEQKQTQKEIGAKVGLAQNVVSQIETEPGRAGVEKLFKMLGALNLELFVRTRSTSKQSSDW